MDGGEYCVSHDPGRVTDLSEWRRKGGQAKSNAARLRKRLPADPLTAEEVHSYLGVVFKGVIGGKLEPGVATAAANVARAMIEVARVADFEAQLAEMRRDLAGLRGAS